MGRAESAFLTRLSVLPWRERGGVRGEARCGRSVGRRAAGVYIGAFGGRIWRFARANWGQVGALWLDVGD